MNPDDLDDGLFELFDNDEIETGESVNETVDDYINKFQSNNDYRESILDHNYTEEVPYYYDIDEMFEYVDDSINNQPKGNMMFDTALTKMPVQFKQKIASTISVEAQANEPSTIINQRYFNKFIAENESAVAQNTSYSTNNWTSGDFREFILKNFTNYNFLSRMTVYVLEENGFLQFRHENKTFTDVFFYGTPEFVQNMTILLDTKMERYEASRNVKWILQGPQGLIELSLPLSYLPAKESFYPFIKKPLTQYFDDYFNSPASVLILIGSPGTGKTSFIKNLLHHTGLLGYVSYDPALFGSDNFFSLLMKEYNPAIAIMEDADNYLSERKEGNEMMHKFLNVSDGIFSASNKKILFSTNLPSIRDIDPALLRGGRCYDVLQFRELTRDEAVVAYRDIHKKELDLNGSEFTLAQLFNPTTTEPVQRTMGF